MENPFIFGKAVVGRHFVDREKEVKEIKSTLASGQNMVLFSPRKMGKTSLIKEAFRQTDNALCVYIDLWQTASVAALASEIVNRVAQATYTSAEKLGRDVRDLLKSIRPRVYLEADGRLGIEFDKIVSKDALTDAIDFPERVANKKKAKIFVAFDEFQEIERLDGNRLEKLFRSVLQHHQRASYIFAGSERSLVETIFGSKDRPFYRFAKHKRLEPIDSDILKKFITGKFEKSGKEIDYEAVQWITDFSKGVPYYVQHICHEVWYATDREANVALVMKTVEENIIPALSSGFQTIWDRIRGKSQRRLLIALANEDEPAIYSHGFIENYNLKSPGHVRRAVLSLEKSGLVEKNEIWDHFFRLWIKRTFSY